MGKINGEDDKMSEQIDASPLLELAKMKIDEPERYEKVIKAYEDVLERTTKHTLTVVTKAANDIKEMFE